MIGATYTARPASPYPGVAQRLKIEAIPRGEDGWVTGERWRFQTLKDGRQISEIRRFKGCPNGRGACSVSPPSRPGPEGGLYSEVVHLNRDFTPSSGDAVPYALVLPNFDRADWLFTQEELASPDLTLAPGETDGPDLSHAISWTLAACGRAAD